MIMSMATTTATGPTLTQIAKSSRLVVKFGSIAIVSLIVGRMLLTTFVAWWKATHPPPPPPPTVGFGVLPKLTFPSQSAEDKPLSYKLETASGTTADFGDRAKVFLVLHPAPSLLADQNAKNIASKFGFLFEPDKLPGKIYRFSKTQPLQSKLELNIVSNHFSIESDYLSHPELLTNPNLPTNFEAVAQVKDFLKKVDLLGPDMATSAGEVLYLKSLGDEVGPAVSPSDADFIQVDLNRTPVDGKFRMYTPTGFEGIVSAILTGSLSASGAENIVEIKSGYNLIDYTQVHTYPIRTSQAAWQLLKAGEGYIVNPGESETATIREVTLGYYDTPDQQEYLQPVFVFYNPEDGFLGYVPAVDPKFTQTE